MSDNNQGYGFYIPKNLSDIQNTNRRGNGDARSREYNVGNNSAGNGASPYNKTKKSDDEKWAYPASPPYVSANIAIPRQPSNNHQNQAGISRTRQNTASASRTVKPNNGNIPPTSFYEMSEVQRKRYEEAYFAKYGKSPYMQKSNATPSAPQKQPQPRLDRREAYSAEYRAREDAARREAAKQAQMRRREEEAKRRAEYERRRAEEEKRRRAAERRRAAMEAIEKKKRRRLFFKRFKFHIVVVALAVIATLALSGIIVYRTLWSKGEHSSESYSYTYGDTVQNNVSKELANPDGDIRINFTRVASLFSFGTVSDSTQFKFIVTEGSEDDPSEGTPTDQYIIFIIGSSTAEVNGTSINLSSSAVYSNGELWVSDDITECFASGMEYSVEKNKVNVARKTEKDDNGKPKRDENGNYIYETVSLKYSLSGDTTDVNLDDIYGNATDYPVNGTPSAVTFTADLSEYEKYMSPEDATPYLILVNKQTTIDESYTPDNLTDVVDTRKDGRATQQMCLTAEKALEAMFIELRANGYNDLSVTSGYRPYAYQKQLFNQYLDQEMANGLDEAAAKEKVLTYSAFPGTSEHQTGLCCDMHNLGAADQAFANKEAYTWLKENCWKFGFIIRFPEGKEDITGYEFEPWHYRFVGRYTAEKIHNEGLCLEEYLEKLGDDF